MKRVKICVLLCVTALTALSLSSCEVHFFSKSYDVAWYYVLIPSVLFIGAALCVAGLVISKSTYVCPKCGHRFHPKFFVSAFSFHSGSDRLFKCPECGQRSLCRKERGQNKK